MACQVLLTAVSTHTTLVVEKHVDRSVGERHGVLATRVSDFDLHEVACAVEIKLIFALMISMPVSSFRRRFTSTRFTGSLMLSTCVRNERSDVRDASAGSHRIVARALYAGLMMSVAYKSPSTAPTAPAIGIQRQCRRRGIEESA